MYKRIRILHRTAYYYHQPVTFGPHRAMLRPREGHDVHIVKGQYQIEPKAAVRWLRDVHGNFDCRNHILRAFRPARDRK